MVLLFLVAKLVNHLPAIQETQIRFLAWEDPLEKEMATTHSSIPAWRSPWTVEPSGPQSTGSKELDTTWWLNHHHRSVFHSCCTKLLSHQQFVSAPFSPHPHQHLLFMFFLMIAFWQIWNDISLWFSFSFPWWLMVLSIFSYACWPSACPFWKNVYSVICPFLIRLFISFTLSCLISHMGHIVSTYFLHSVYCLFILPVFPLLCYSFSF